VFAASVVVLAMLAQGAPQPASAEAKARAQVLLKSGAQSYEAGDLVSALEKFKQAYAEFASPKLLFNIGQTSRELGRDVEAIEAFQHFLAEAGDAPEELKAEAWKSSGELQARLGRVHVECETKGADIGVDGKPIGQAPIKDLVWILPGRHRVTASQSNGKALVQNVEVAGGDVLNVVLRADPQTEPDIAAGPKETQLDLRRSSFGPASGPDQGWWMGRRWTWVAGGSAIVLAGTAALVGLTIQSRFDDLNYTCGSQSSNAGGCKESDIQALRTRATTANVLWGLAGTAAVTAGILFFVEGQPITVSPMAGMSTGLLASVRY